MACLAMPPSELSLVRAAAAAGDWRVAIRIAAKFQQLGPHKEAVTRAWSAIQQPDFYRAIGQDPEELIDAGAAAVRERYEI